jgi:hypothetical protein
VRTKGIVVVALLIAGGLVQLRATTSRVIGVIAAIERQAAPTLTVTAKGMETQTVRTSGQTAYMKWINHKPWQRDASANTSSLIEGRCVEVEMRSDESGVAKTIWISDEPAGSLYDPCKARR